MIEIRNLNYQYNKKFPLVLDDVSFFVQEGKINVLLGPNGIGKSTIIKCIDRILDYQDGQIFIDDKNVKEYKRNDLAKIISYVSQDSKISYLNVYECILLGRTPYIQYFSKEKDDEIVTSLLREFHMEDFATRPFNSLSGGEKQIVMILRCLAQQTPIILLDEPTANLDIKNTLMVLNFIKKLVKEKNLTILISMHDISTAYLIGDHFILMKNKTENVEVDKEGLTSELLKEIFAVDFVLDRENEFIYLRGDNYEEN